MHSTDCQKLSVSHDNFKFAGDYGVVTLTHIASLLSPKVRSALGHPASATYPQTFEALGNYFGYVLYETFVPSDVEQVSELIAPDVRDRAVILLDGERVATLTREHKTYNTTLATPPSAKLSVLVENLGRINYGPYNNDTKGLGNVTLAGVPLTDWSMTGFTMESVAPILNCNAKCLLGSGFRFYGAKFVLPANTSGSHPPDTFIDVSSLKKGLVFINDHNLGRYWTHRGPQYSLYVPGVWLNPPPKENVIVVFDEKAKSESINVKFSTTPIWSSKTRIKF